MNILCGTVVVGGGYYDVFDLSSYELLSGQRQCGRRKRRRQRQQLGGSAVLALAAVRRRQCVVSAVAVGSSVAAMFPLFITHDEYFVRCGGNGGGTNFLVDKIA